MPSKAIVVASLALAAVASFAMIKLAMPAPVEVRSDPELAVLAERIGKLEQRLDGVVADLAARPAPDERRPVDATNRAAIEAAVEAAVEAAIEAAVEAAVAKHLKARPDVAAAAAGTPPRMDLQPLFHSLLADIGQDATWEKLREAGQIEDMVKLFAGHAAANPTSADAQTLYGVAICYQLEGMQPTMESGLLAHKADKLFDKALELDDDHWDARFVKAQALSFWPAMFGRQPEAMRHLEVLRTKQEAKTQEKRFAQTYGLLGNLYAQQGKAEKAREVWEAGARLFPENRELRKKVEAK